ncbi:MAG: c-type cytochrome [Vicinamibacterales bacterium]
MRWTLVSRAAVAAVLAPGIMTAALFLSRDTVYSHTPITTTIVFQKEIARIFQKKCFQCHTPGNLAMSLTTYKDARPWAVAIKEEILERRMPPWSAVSGYGHFANDMSLTTREVSLILAWADGGAPAGVLLAEQDKPPVFVPPLRGWEQGPPDAVVKVATDHKVEASAKDYIARFDVSTNVTDPRWVRSLQLNPTDRRVLRYAAVYESDTRRWLGTWTPAQQITSWPTSAAIRLPARAKLTVEIGYRGAEEAASGESELGLYFSERRPGDLVSTIELAAPAINLPASATGQRVRTEMTIKAATTATAVWPTMGSGGKSLEVTVIRPDGAVEPLLWLKDYRADWPSPYIFRDPVLLPTGSRVVLTAYYDNAGDTPLQARPAIALTAFTPSPQAAARGR